MLKTHLTAIVAVLMAATPIAGLSAGELHGRAWDYNVRGSSSAMSRAAMIWQAEQQASQQSASGSAGTAAAVGGVGAGGSGAGGSGAGGFGSTANYSIITVVLDDGATGDVDVLTHQDSVGDQSAQAISIQEQTGDTMSVTIP